MKHLLLCVLFVALCTGQVCVPPVAPAPADADNNPSGQTTPDNNTDGSGNNDQNQNDDQAGDNSTNDVINNNDGNNDITKDTQVPNCVGMSYHEASAAIVDAGLKVGTIMYLFGGDVSSIGVNHVVKQLPEAGEMVSDGDLISIYVTAIHVPDGKWVGTTSEDQDMSFVVKDEKIVAYAVVFIDNGHINKVLTPGTLSISILGLFPAFSFLDTSMGDFAGQMNSDLSATGTAIEWWTEKQVSWQAEYMGNETEVPNVVGEAFDKEEEPNLPESELLCAGLVLGEVTYEHSNSIQKGDIVSQDPAAGKLVDLGTKVDLVVSLGPE